MNDPEGHAFISYVREDSWRVDRLQTALADAGIRAWRDTGQLWPGQDWRAEIRGAITADSLAFLACFSDSTGRRQVTYQTQELLLAVEQMRLHPPGTPWLIPVRFTPCDVPDLDIGADQTLTSLQHVDLFDGSWERAIPRLLRVVLSVLHERSVDLHRLLERSGMGKESLTEFMEAAGHVPSSVSPLLLRLARRQVGTAAWFLRQLPGGGEIAYDGEDREWLLGLTAEAQQSIDATSFSTVDTGAHGADGGLWVSDLGARYLEAQRDAASRNVAIRRIFVIDDPSLASDDVFLTMVDIQREVGVDVRVLDHERIPDWLKWVVSDFIVFDNAVGYEATLNAGKIRPAIVRTLISPIPARARQLAEQFRQLWLAAEPDQQTADPT